MHIPILYRRKHKHDVVHACRKKFIIGEKKIRNDDLLGVGVLNIIVIIYIYCIYREYIIEYVIFVFVNVGTIMCGWKHG